MPIKNDFKELATEFHEWMQHHFKESLDDGTLSDQTTFFLHYIETTPKAMEIIHTYDDLCALASLVNEYEYDVDSPPCTHAEFKKLNVCDIELDELDERNRCSTPYKNNI